MQAQGFAAPSAEGRPSPWRVLAAVAALALASLPPGEVTKVVVNALHVAARTDDLVDVERYLQRSLRNGELGLSALRYDYGLRPAR